MKRYLRVGGRKRRAGTYSSSEKGRALFTVGRDIPLVGHIAFGIIDRGTNLLQVRPSTACPLSCIFCSVDAGPRSRYRATEYVVELSHLLSWFRAVVEFKEIDDAQAHIDAVGDPLTYPRIVELVSRLRRMRGVKVVSLETHGALLTRELAEKLSDAGLSRMNLSIDALDQDLARTLSGEEWFDVERVLDVARYITSSLEMDLMITPVWIPGLNDGEIGKIIDFALEIGAGRVWPPLGIQKYEAHRYGRKPRGIKPIRWRDFYRRLRGWEAEYGVKLVLSPSDFDIRRARPVPTVFRRFEKAIVKVVGPGWLKGQWLGKAKNRSIAVVGVEGPPPLGKNVGVKILRTKDNIYVAESLL